MLRPILLVAAGFVVVACSGGLVDKTPPDQQGGVVMPDAGIHVTAAVASATLGDQGCSGSTTAASAGICAARQSDAAADINPCDAACRPSTIQVQFTAADGTTPAHVDVGDVLLLDSTGATLQNLSASNPRAWDAATSSYTPWDQTISPSSEVKASYTLSSPSWSTFGNSYSSTYRLQITLHIDGMTLVLQTGPLTREPLVAT